MSTDRQNVHGELPVEAVEAQLRLWAAVEPPLSLKDKLVAAIPGTADVRPKGRSIWPGSREVRWASAAAAVILVAAVVGWLGYPVGERASPGPNAAERAGRVLAADHNSLQTPDMNAFDTNGVR